MPDWKLVIDRKIGCHLRDIYRTEVVKELAAHMEDEHEELIATGTPADEAYDRVLDRVRNWCELGRQVRWAKEEQVRNVFKHILIPGMIALAASSAAQNLLFRVNGWSAVWKFGSYGLILNWPWLVTMPIVGAAIAYSVLRLGGSRRARLLAAVFPSLVIAGMLVILFPLSFVIDHHVAFAVKMTSFAMVFLSWALLPTIATCIGAFPFLWPRVRIIQTHSGEPA